MNIYIYIYIYTYIHKCINMHMCACVASDASACVSIAGPSTLLRVMPTDA